MGAVEPGKSGTVTQVLAPGRYAITDDETEGGMGEGKTYAQLGAKGEFTVTGPAPDAELPDQPATVTATDDGKDEYGFEFEGLTPGDYAVVCFINDRKGGKPHVNQGTIEEFTIE